MHPVNTNIFFLVKTYIIVLISIAYIQKLKIHLRIWEEEHSKHVFVVE
jgi:hypothetical protein